MSRKHQPVLVNDPECFTKGLPSIRVTAGTDVVADDDGHIVIGFTCDYPENDVFKYVEASGIYGDMFMAKRPCTLIYSGAIFRDVTTDRGNVIVAQGKLSADYGQISPTVYSTGVAAPSGELMFNIAGVATLDTDEAISFLLDNASAAATFSSMVITSVNPA